MATNREVTNSGGFFSVVKIKVNVGQVKNFKVFRFGLVQDDFFVSGLPILIEARKVFELIIDVFEVKGLVELWAAKAFANSSFFEETGDSGLDGQWSKLFGDVLAKLFGPI